MEMLDAKALRTALGCSTATAYRRFAVAVLLAGPRVQRRATGKRDAVLVPADVAARVVGVSVDDLLRLAGVVATDGGRVAA